MGHKCVIGFGTLADQILQRLLYSANPSQLVHWPMGNDPETKRSRPIDQSPTYNETWAEMEKLVQTDKCKAIGYSLISLLQCHRTPLKFR
jgi:diketogulonate reductase-like aldo/keto reductase